MFPLRPRPRRTKPPDIAYCPAIEARGGGCLYAAAKLIQIAQVEASRDISAAYKNEKKKKLSSSSSRIREHLVPFPQRVGYVREERDLTCDFSVLTIFLESISAPV